MEHDKVLKIPNDFSEKIKNIFYNSQKNVVFASSRDGRFKCWKLPIQWGSKEMEELDN